MDHQSAHLRIVIAFVMREVATRYGRSPGGYLWALLEPIAYVAMMSAIFSSFARVPAMGESFPHFFATGFIAYGMYNGMVNYLSSSIAANKNLMQYPRVAPIDPIVGRAILQALTSIVVGFIILAGTRKLEAHPHDIIWSAVLEAVIFAWTLASGVALTNIVLFERFPLYQKIFGIVTRPLFMLSGVFYIPSQMPHPYREVLLANPITQIVIIFREGFYGVRATDGVNFSYVFWWSIVVAFVGLFIFTMWPVGRTR
ncbi:ABC transporter permease [Neorhizobium petrolearium]|uniref:Transport permease protein n=1 Tax=Neorhizobium petrolearium TaxID=515361 RepID=A0ABY8M2E7_9HYPH|nr:ABC transporter permease [Neorhizobium petrolearium]MCC2608404.1 ABC transporter permease [Neorhizobium petrolearium]WGI68682.1 ABC transporter permease [Neorhizobium petrolearium]